MDLGIIIRTTGEPTLYGLIEQLQVQFGKKTPLKIVTADSFGKVLMLSYEEAISLKKEWSLIIDGDILVGWHFKSSLKRASKKVSPHALGFGLRVFDRFYDRPKFRGVHIYRSAYLEEASDYLSNAQNQLRPETFVKECMQLSGKNWDSFNTVVGLHDFFQKPEEIFAKMAIRAHRSPNDMQHLIAKISHYARKGEADFQYALAGLQYGISLPKEEIKNERNFYAQAFNKQFPALSNKEVDIPSNFILNKILISKLFEHSPIEFPQNLFHVHPGR